MRATLELSARENPLANAPAIFFNGLFGAKGGMNIIWPSGEKCSSHSMPKETQAQDTDE